MITNDFTGHYYQNFKETDFLTSAMEHLDPLSAVEEMDNLSLKTRKLNYLQNNLEKIEWRSGLAAFVSAIALIVICCIPPVSIGTAVGLGLFFVASCIVNRLSTSSLDAIANQTLNDFEEVFNYKRKMNRH